MKATVAPPPTTQPPPTKPPTTPIPLDKDALLKKAAELDKLAKDEIDKFDKLSRRALVSNIESLDQTILDLAAKIKTTSGVLPLQVLESQLYWLETELGVEIDAIESAYNRIMKMVNDAQVLDARIDKGIIKMGPDTPVGKALKEEKESLAKVVNSLRAATDERTIRVLEFDLALIEERVFLIAGSLQDNYDNTLDFPTKEELEARVVELKDSLEKDAARLRGDPRIDTRELATLDLYDTELRVLSTDLHIETDHKRILSLLVQLDDLVIRVDVEINRLEQLLDRLPVPSPTKAPAPTPAPTRAHSPTQAHTKSPAPTQVPTKITTTQLSTTNPSITTQTPLDKDALLKKAAELDKLAKDEITKFDKQQRRALVANIESLNQNIQDLTAKMNTTSGVLPLQVLESQLFWLER
ncbi:unnamed protein product [Oppiella nova]|uniref:Uncharacterized protein n=1 Tax=Oppiella nova TaxID=334625 RepID=A0A7R9LHQ4_9ACAR|nr:unnamed protein product [Oppiella nova]CAG2163771.1 unnamed protein product [Oppiella nova]